MDQSPCAQALDVQSKRIRASDLTSIKQNVLMNSSRLLMNPEAGVASGRGSAPSAAALAVQARDLVRPVADGEVSDLQARQSRYGWHRFSINVHNEGDPTWKSYTDGVSSMKGLTAIRLAALLAIGYGLWILAGGAMHVGAGAGAITLRASIGHWVSWLVGLLSLMLAWALWARQAWSWWLALAAALFQGWRLVSAHLAHHVVARIPDPRTVAVLVLLLVFVVLLFMPKARAACNR